MTYDEAKQLIHDAFATKPNAVLRFTAYRAAVLIIEDGVRDLTDLLLDGIPAYQEYSEDECRHDILFPDDDPEHDYTDDMAGFVEWMKNWP